MNSDVCTEEEKKSCEKEFPDYLEWACSQCEKKKDHDIHPYTYHLLRLRRLLRAGFPFEKNDLSLQVWEDLAMVDEMITLKTRVL